MAGDRAKPDWIGEGLHFSCTMCGACCTGPEGYVLFTDEDLARMSAHLGMTEDAFLKKYSHETEAGRSLTEFKTVHGFDCVFLDRETIPGKAVCSIHEARPTQCRTFPWWPGNVKTRHVWDRLERECEGVNRIEDGSFIPRDEIVRNLRAQLESEGEQMKSKRVTGLVLVVFSAILLIGGPLMFLGSPGGVVVAHLPGGYVYMDDGDPVIIWLGGGFNEDRFGDARPAAIHGEFEKIAAKGDYVFGFVQQKGTKSDSRVAPGWFILNTALGRSELSLDLATYNNRIRELGLDPSRVDYQTP